MCMVSLYLLVCIFIWVIADSAWLGGTHLCEALARTTPSAEVEPQGELGGGSYPQFEPSS